MKLNTLSYAPEGAETQPPLVVAHGLFGSARNWNTLAGKMAQGRRVIAVDMRNHGDSPHADGMTYADMAGDLAETIRAEAGGKADLLGHSMGGKAAMTLALTDPAPINRLIVADIAPVAYTHTHTPHVEAMQSVDLSAVTRRGEVDRLLAERVPDRSLRAFLLQSLSLSDGAPRWKLNLPVLKAHMDDMIGFPAFDTSFDGPAFFLHGGASDYAGADTHAGIRRLFPKAEIAAIEGAGHWLHAEKPDEFVKAVLAWLG